MRVDAQEDQRCDGCPTGAVGHKTVQIVLCQEFGGNGVDRVRLNGPSGLRQWGEQLGAAVYGCGGDVGVQRILRAYCPRLGLVNGLALVNQLAFASGVAQVDATALDASRPPG